MSLETFVAALAERTPAPGGGAAAAAGCALGAALAEMAARFAGRDDDVAHAAALRDAALRLGEADLTAYAPVLEAQRLAADDPERPARVAAAQAAAAEVPLAIAETAAQAAELARALAARRASRAGRRCARGRRSRRRRSACGGAAGRDQPGRRDAAIRGSRERARRSRALRAEGLCENRQGQPLNTRRPPCRSPCRDLRRRSSLAAPRRRRRRDGADPGRGLEWASGQPVQTSSFTHFALVLSGALAAAVASAILTIAGVKRRDGRTVLLGTAFSTMTALLAVHGFATPGVIAGPNGVVAFAGAASLPAGALVLALSALPALRRPRHIGPLIALQVTIARRDPRARRERARVPRARPRRAADR